MMRGLVTGRFLPPHLGHVTLAQTARALCDQLTILVCSGPSDPLPGEVRRGWLAGLVPGARVLHLPDAAPQPPPDRADAWRAAIRALHPEPIDAVIGAHLAIVRLADALGADPVVIDPERIAVPVAAAAVRADPAAQWRWLPDPVRRHYQTRVTVFGAESTGKSTLVAELARQHGSLFMPEHGRAFELYRPIGPYRPGELLELARRHAAHRDTLAPLAGPILFEDTDALTTAVWARMMDQPEPALEAAPLADLYLVPAPDVPFVQDGIRYFEGEARQRFHQTGLDLLGARGARWQPLTGTWDQRRAQALRAVASLRGT